MGKNDEEKQRKYTTSWLLILLITVNQKTLRLSFKKYIAISLTKIKRTMKLRGQMNFPRKTFQFLKY